MGEKNCYAGWYSKTDGRSPEHRRRVWLRHRIRQTCKAIMLVAGIVVACVIVSRIW